MLQALLERGVQPDVLIGCSAGALNAAAFASQPTGGGIARLRDLWSVLQSADVFPPGILFGPWALARKGESLYSNEGLRKIIHSWLPLPRFEDCAIPLHVVATSLRTGLERWFSSGDMLNPLLASSALPAVFPPVPIDGEPFIDGGVVDNVPISRAFELGAKRIYVLHVGNFERTRPDPKRPIDVLVQAFSIARAYRFRAEIAHDDHEGVELITIPGIDPGSLKYNDFSKSGQLIDRARQRAAAYLDARAAEATGS